MAGMETSLHGQERKEVCPLCCPHLRILFAVPATILHLNSKEVNPCMVNIYVDTSNGLLQQKLQCLQMLYYSIKLEYLLI